MQLEAVTSNLGWVIIVSLTALFILRAQKYKNMIPTQAALLKISTVSQIVWELNRMGERTSRDEFEPDYLLSIAPEIIPSLGNH